MDLRLERATEVQLTSCVSVFFGSDIYEHYFKGEGQMERTLRTGLEKGDLYVAVTPTGEIAGAMRFDPRGFCGLYPYLSLIGVRNTFQGKGVGAFLMDRLEEQSRAAGTHRVTLMVSDFNAPAQAFYRARGYWQLGTLPNAARPGIAELLLVKDLV